ncbi:MAG: hypothetical protein APF76_16375 [Desulfitibacter sp. BRH_c19]|nr:MAG: hypothetical protein APF76_16375 [Desulfitibacter sp. BRH_c19]
MIISLYDVLGLDLMKDVQVVAGKSNLGQEINSVHMVDILDRVPAFKKNDFIITTGYDLINNEELLLKIVNNLSHGNVSCLAIQIGIFLDEIPSQLIIHCDALNLPLLEIPKSLSAAEIVKAIYVDINTCTSLKYISEHERNLRFVQLLLQEKGMSEIAAFLSDSISMPVRILDEHFNLIAHHGFDTSLDLLNPQQIILEYENLKKDNHFKDLLESKSIYYLSNESNGLKPSHLLYPIKVNSILHGYISIIGVDNSKIHKQDFMPHIEIGAVVCAIELLQEKAIWEAQDRISGDFLDKLLDGNLKSVKHLNRRAAHFGLDHTKNFTIVIMEIDDFAILKNQKTNRELIEIKKLIQSYAKSCLYFQQHKTMLKYRSDKLCILCQLAKDCTKEHLDNMAKQLQKAVKDNLAISVSVGFGKYHANLGDLPVIYKEAEKALSIGKKLWKKEYTVFYEDLGVYKLFANVEGKGELNSYYHSTVHPLMRHDKEYSSDLMMTLEAFLDNNGSIKETSENLYLHRHTLRYRLNKIKEITNLDPQDCQDRFKLQMGIVVHHLLSDGLEG